jgi:prophage maintenance system killer protein
VYPTLAAKAAVLLYSLSKSQACPTGNKRTAVILLIAFLTINSAALEATSDELFQKVTETAESPPGSRLLQINELTEWFERVIVETQQEEES